LSFAEVTTVLSDSKATNSPDPFDDVVIYPETPSPLTSSEILID
jgi:hypothetical protein